jgi:hypothetical protein
LRTHRSLRHHPEIVREVLGVPEDVGILCGLCFGYEDVTVPVNRTHTVRSDVAENVRFIE